MTYTEATPHLKMRSTTEKRQEIIDRACLALSSINELGNQVHWYPNYVKDKLPHRQNNGSDEYPRAPELTYNSAQIGWQLKNNEINGLMEKGRKNAQIIVITHENDVTQGLDKTLQDKSLTDSPVTKSTSTDFADGCYKIITLNENPEAEHVYIIASGKTPADMDKIGAVARQFKAHRGKKFVTVVASVIGEAREDKTLDADMKEMHNALLAEKVVNDLSKNVDRLIVLEPHSSGIQGYAAAQEKPMPVLPISVWKYMVDKVIPKDEITGKRLIKIKEKSETGEIEEKDVEVNKNNFIVVRPDKGRNIAAKRMEKYLDLDYVAFNKLRKGPTEVEFDELKLEEIEKVKGKYIIMFDDEVEGMGTAEGIMNKLQKYEAKGVIFLFAHEKLAGSKWEKRMRHPLLLKAYGTDSLTPIGNPQLVEDVLTNISVDELLVDLIKADLEGVDFWSDQRFCDSILQVKDGSEDCE